MAPQEPPLLIISSSAHTFDPDQLAQWTEEGYRVHYVSGAGVELFADLAEEVESCDGYGIIAYGTPALHALSFAASPISRLKAVIAYYPPALPTSLPHPEVKRVVIHLAGCQPFSQSTAVSAGIVTGSSTVQAGGGGGGGILHNLLYSGHRRQTSLGSGNNGGGGGMDAGEAMRKSQMKRYAYEGCSIWFAEMATTRHGRSGTGGGAEGLSKIHGAGDGRGYDATANSLSLERSIQALEAAGLTGVPRYSVEETWSCFLHALFTARDIDALLKCMPGERSGGSWIGGEAVGRFLPTNIVGKGKMFWEEVVLNGMPQSLKTKTVNRTVGARQVVEELELVFWDDGGAGEGRGEMGWLIGVGEGGRVLKTRGKKVKEVIVLSGKVRAGKVVEVKGYWDRESVLRQVEGDGEGDGETLVGN